MIEMLGELLRAIFSLIAQGNTERAGQMIHEAYLSLLRNDAAFFQQISLETFTQTLLENHNYTNAHLEVLAELLYAEASLLRSQNKLAESNPYLQKSLLLFEFVDRTYRTYSADRLMKIEMIRSQL